MTEEAVPPNDQDNGLLLDASTVVNLLLDGTDNRAFGHAVLERTFLEVANTLYRIGSIFQVVGFSATRTVVRNS